MESHDPVHVIAMLEIADAQGNPSAIFSLVPEATVWASVSAILKDPQQRGTVGPTLIQSIGASLLHLNDRLAIHATLLQAIHPTMDSLVYSAAQQVILNFADVWDLNASKDFYEAFVYAYKQTAERGDKFIATLALEGFILLPLYRSDQRLLALAVALLLNDFPPLPTDPEDAALLPVKALKLLGQCYDQRPDDLIVDQVQTLKGHSNRFVDTEARFNLGIIRLYDAFRAADELTFQTSLNEAHTLFLAAVQAEEGRTDAAFFATITRCYNQLATTLALDDISEVVNTAKHLLSERLLVFGGTTSEARKQVEIALVRLIATFERWAEQVETAHQQPNIGLPMRELATIYAAIRSHNVDQGIVSAASNTAARHVLLPQLRGRFVKIQEIKVKLTSILADPAWRATAAEAEVAFYELVLQEVQQAPDPKLQATVRLETIRAVAERDAPELAEIIKAIQNSGLSTEEQLLQITWRWLDERRTGLQTMFSQHGPAQDIYQYFASNLLQKLQWNPNDLPWQYLSNTLKVVARYFVRMYQTTRAEATPSDVRFLYSEESGGIGKAATEQHLEGNFYSVMGLFEWGGVLERQAQTGLPGRGDLLFRYPRDIVFPLEVKAESRDSSPANIRAKYLTQAQSYAAGTHQVCFLFVLDTTTKPRGQPLKNVRDYCYIDQRIVPETTHADYVAVFIFPANRYRPSDHSG